MLALPEKQMLIQALGRLVSEEIENAVKPLVNRIQQLEKMLGDMPVPVDGKDGKDGKDGRDGTDGKEAIIPWDYLNEQLSAGMEMLGNQLDKKIAALPKAEKGEPGEPGKDGKDGADGRDGENLSLDDVRDCLSDLVSKAIGNLPVPRYCTGGFIDRDGSLHHTFSDGSIVDLGEVVGKDGKDCDMEVVHKWVDGFFATIDKPKDGKDGKDGVGFDDMHLEYDGERTLILNFVKGDNRKSWNLLLPIPLYKGVWREGGYERGDCVHRDGGMFIALKDTRTEPGTIKSDWQLCTKRGRDGKNGERGPQGPSGNDGRPGRDLTQVGPDGSKW